MKRPLRPEELRLWRLVAGTVHPFQGRTVPEPPAEPVATAPETLKPAKAKGPAPAPAKTTTVAAPREPEPIEPGRKRRLTRERDEIGGRIDLHGLDQDRAQAALDAFLLRAWDQGFRAVLVITGKGSRGDGVLRRRAPEWLAAAHLRPVVAGISEAHRRHGGEGALYVALKRKPRT